MRAPETGVWLHCGPALASTGVSCHGTPRRPCECPFDGSHDHLVSPSVALLTVAARMRTAAAKAPYGEYSEASEYWRGYRAAAVEAAGALTELAERCDPG